MAAACLWARGARVEAKMRKAELQLHPIPLPTELFQAPPGAKKAVHLPERKLREAQDSQTTRTHKKPSELTQAQRCPYAFPRCARGLT